MNLPSFELDDWLVEHIEWQPCWKAELNNGKTAIQDDGRPGETVSSWIRLKNYVRDNNIKIRRVFLDYRGVTTFPVPDDCHSYFFINSCLSAIGEFPVNYIKIGFQKNKDSFLYIVKIRLPDLCYVGHEIVPADDSSPFLIKNEN
jgi:hypothetical protein